MRLVCVLSPGRESTWAFANPSVVGSVLWFVLTLPWRWGPHPWDRLPTGCLRSRLSPTLVDGSGPPRSCFVSASRGYGLRSGGVRGGRVNGVVGIRRYDLARRMQWGVVRGRHERF